MEINIFVVFLALGLVAGLYAYAYLLHILDFMK